jgi:hypothetical protein
MNQQRNLAAEIKPRRMHNRELAGFQLQFDCRAGYAAQAHPSHNGSLHRAYASKLQRSMEQAELARDRLLEDFARS